MSWDWLPDRQLHVVETLGHVDEQIADLYQRVLDYTANALVLKETRLPNGFRLAVDEITPLPAGISRLAADILNGLRGALEHVLMSEVIVAAGRQLTDDEERAVEFPLASDVAAWVGRSRYRKSHPGFQADGALVARITELQPGVDETHPLRLLVEHTNRMKHRVPAVVATHHAAVTIVDRVSGGVTMQKRPGPVAVGDVIAETRNPSAVDSFSYVALERPNTGETVILVAEIEKIEKWVREVAVPVLVTGTPHDPPLPSGLPTKVSHRDIRLALDRVADVPPAVVRIQALAQLALARTGLRDVLLDRVSGNDASGVRAWVETLDLPTTIRYLEELHAAGERGVGEEAAQFVIQAAIRSQGGAGGD